ncbi:hypothetical protein JJQ94_19425 [Pseudoalteromonas sp. GCY]|nr:hypothetical protein [Pseudoalteromonas sp. GCY]QQQ66424.1 hypothetical protein JJQ94_19425 [Pseudoalteromonas sp. GCY]
MKFRNLKSCELKSVFGGSSNQVRENAETAKDVCGKGNVKSVTKDGFECK